MKITYLQLRNLIGQTVTAMVQVIINAGSQINACMGKSSCVGDK